ncbi:hypothetical protein [Streptomyces sp. NPDC000134]|uniref:hypothetical protein n=1 Tax=Streptomyces sp. NPDC000134 TaxID=3364536 RepID=UPI0036B88FB2
MTGGKQHPQRFAFATEAGLDWMLGGQGLLGSPDGVEHVGLAAAAVGRSFRAADLDDLLTGLVQEDREAGALAADAFQGPAAAAGNLLAGEVQQALVAADIG